MRITMAIVIIITNTTFFQRRNRVNSVPSSQRPLRSTIDRCPFTTPKSTRNHSCFGMYRVCSLNDQKFTRRHGSYIRSTRKTKNADKIRLPHKAAIIETTRAISICKTISPAMTTHLPRASQTSPPRYGFVVTMAWTSPPLLLFLFSVGRYRVTSSPPIAHTSTHSLQSKNCVYCPRSSMLNTCIIWKYAPIITTAEQHPLTHNIVVDIDMHQPHPPSQTLPP